ncbi:hypothetical protein CXB51_018131 [Gossypium anomalum]|uniref:Uncharacterized protein n=1 Tax=Gossypium anomalum TaxID=47600 RepID=A0A8J5YSA3_9ROSI|nr:hypothetical protein CXB51_018131 [Gossypium anomalum]
MIRSFYLQKSPLPFFSFSLVNLFFKLNSKSNPKTVPFPFISRIRCSKLNFATVHSPLFGFSPINQMLLLIPPSLHFLSRRFVLLQSVYISRRNFSRFLATRSIVVASIPNSTKTMVKIFSSSKLLFSFQREQHLMSKAKITSIGQSFLSRFPTPTIFLKISCDGDFLLPIIVVLINLLMLGEFAFEKLIASFWGDDNGEYPDQFHLVQNVVEKLGYEVW